MKKDLISANDLSANDVQSIFRLTKNPKKNSLKEKIVILAFFEPSTRTRLSFEMAAKSLGANVLHISSEGSSVQKGESLAETLATLNAIGPDALVIRHQASGAAMMASKIMSCPVINAGDGTHEHPTQALTDLFTIQKEKEKMKDLHVAIVGDILHSRVAHSDSILLQAMGAKIHLVGPRSLVPASFKNPGVSLHHDWGNLLSTIDVIILLRIQKERLKENFFTSTGEFAARYGLNRDRLKQMKPDAMILDPGPVDVGVSCTEEVLQDPRCFVKKQVANGVIVRRALLQKLLYVDS